MHTVLGAVKNPAWILVFAAFMAFGAIAGCGQREDAKTVRVASVEDGYIAVLDGITGAMRDNGPSEAVLGHVRTHVAGARDTLREAVRKLNIDVLAMNEAERGAWRARARTRLAASLDEFAKAQADLLKRLDDAQKWELGEILRTLQ